MVRRLRRKSTQQATAGDPSSAAHPGSVGRAKPRLAQQYRELMDQIDSLRRVLAKEAGKATEAVQEKEQRHRLRRPLPIPSKGASTERGHTFAVRKNPFKWGRYTPNYGYKVADTDHGDISVSIIATCTLPKSIRTQPNLHRRIWQRKNCQQRQDFQLQKVQIKFLGWMLDPKFRYFLYAWSSNASQGLGAQVVLAGNLNYSFNKFVSIGAGIRSLPGTRSVEGNFPFWLGVDTAPDSRRVFPSFVHVRGLGLGPNHEAAGLHHDDRQQPEYSGRAQRSLTMASTPFPTRWSGSLRPGNLAPALAISKTIRS